MNYYFDTSSIVKIYHAEDGSKDVLELYRSRATILISELSKIEFLSAVYRKYRENEISLETLNAVILKFQDDIESRYELLEFSSLVFEESWRLVCDFAQKYSLKTLDSLQFAFFTTYCEEDDIFVCSDMKLTSIVVLEGITVFVPKGHIPFHRTKIGDINKLPTRIFLSPPHMGGEEMRFVREAFESNYIAPIGPMVDAFEQEFAAKVGIPHAVAVSSGTAAIHLALRALGVGLGDEVIVSTLTFIGGVTPVVFQGATPVFIDSDQGSWDMDPALLAEELAVCEKKGRYPKAVVPTDLYGQCADLDQILEICERHKIPVVVDAAEALGATYKGRSAGAGATAAVFSFNGNKIITTSSGGMLASDNEALIKKARFLSQQARDPAPHYEHSQIGYNYRMSNVLAAIGLGQLSVLDDRVEAKRRIFDYYKDALGEVPGIEFMPEAPYGRSNRWLTVILITPEEFGADREGVRLALEAKNIEARPVWKPMHLQPVFNPRISRITPIPPARATGQSHTTQIMGKKKGYNARVVGGEVAEDLFERGLCLPSGTAMTEGDLVRVIETILNCRTG
jgi:dTDP-4-amino-4,6-dideoxygalactose transaminase/predicted nucleic acid-binding protein